MTITSSRVLADAWALWRRDRDVLVRLAAPFVLLPSLALLLLVPEPPTPDGAGLLEALRLHGRFQHDHAGAILLAAAAAQFGCAALYAFYCDPRARDVRGALGRAALLWPRLVLLALMVQVAAAAGLLLLVVPALIVLGRVLPAGPLLFSGTRSAAGAFGRAVRCTAGHTLAVTALAGLVLAGHLVAALPFQRMDAWLRSLHASNPVALAIIDGAGAGVDMLATIAGVLVAVSLYRALSGGAGASSGT